jgi:hypothetical protein
MDWAKSDYGIDPISVLASNTTGFHSRRRSNFGKTENSRFFIQDETDFIHKIRNRYIKQKNNETATII